MSENHVIFQVSIREKKLKMFNDYYAAMKAVNGRTKKTEILEKMFDYFFENERHKKIADAGREMIANIKSTIGSDD